MKPMAPGGSRRILIHGLGRSGTSWLMKIFDQHPMVFASHEPEAFLPQPALTMPNPPDLSPGEVAQQTQAYLEHLFGARPLRAMRKRPVLQKAFRPAMAHSLRQGLMLGMSVIERSVLSSARGWQVPDLASMSDVTMAVKCVSHQAMAPLIAEHCPDVKVIALIRHPCGNVASHDHGHRASLMADVYLPPRPEMARLFTFDRPIEALTEADFSLLEILAYRWAVYNDLLVRRLALHPSARIVTYEDLCVDPVGVSKALFDWCGLDWSTRCEAFLEASLSAEGDATGYHDLKRNPAVAAARWRATMSPEDVETVLSICRKSAAYTLFDGAAEGVCGGDP